MTGFDIERFVEAQESEYSGYAQALKEMQAGEKHGHWIWYIFPQLRGLGHSGNANFYGIEDIRQIVGLPLHISLVEKNLKKELKMMIFMNMLNLSAIITELQKIKLKNLEIKDTMSFLKSR